MTGIGGGSLMTPMLILVFGVQPVTAIGTDLAYAAVTKTVGGWKHLRQKTVDLTLSSWMALGSVPAAIGGVYVLTLLEDWLGRDFEDAVIAILAGALLLTGTATLVRAFLKRMHERERDTIEMERRHKLAAVLLGLGVGFVLGVTSAGSGALIAVGLILLFRLSPQRVVGTDVFHAAILLWAAGLAHVTAGNVDFALAGTILLGSVPGVWLGSHWSVRVEPAVLRTTLAVVLIGAGLALQIEAVVERLQAGGVHAKVMPGELTTAIGAIGDPEGVLEMGLEGLAGVDRVIPISRPYKVASSELSHHEPTVFEVGDHRIGAPDTFSLVAGPCTVESRDQTLGVARAVAAAGASMLRGGAYKPRTSPFAFQGLGTEGLEILREAREETGLPVVSEMTSSQLADQFAEAVDVIQVGARNMQNYGLLEGVGKLGKPVLLKRGLSSTLDELLQAADYVLKEGNERVILCERGIRTFDNAMRFTLDLGAVPWLKLHTHLPVIVDPSHASGDRRLVGPLSRAAAAAGAGGIIVEGHRDPELALCDGPPQLYAESFDRFARRLELARRPVFGGWRAGAKERDAQCGGRGGEHGTEEEGGVVTAGEGLESA